jgi:hypothetical protein
MPRLRLLGYIIVLICAEAILGNTVLSQSVSPPDDATIRREAADVARVFEVEGRVTIAEGGSIESDFATGVRISRQQLQQYLDGVEPGTILATLRFIIAHEFWHQRQYRIYGPDIRDTDEERSRVYECQADVMAGRYVAASLAANTLDAGRVFRAVHSMVARLGVPRYSRSTHPTSDQRRVAVQHGGAYAAYEILAMTETTEASAIRATAARVWDISGSESVVAWALRRCRSIVHAGGTALASVVVDRTTIDWSRAAEQPFVGFSIPYRNVGTRPIRLSVEVQSAAVPRANRADLARRVRVDALNVLVDLEPGAAYVVRGRLMWHADDELMPILVYPPEDPGSLVSADYIGLDERRAVASPNWANLPAAAVSLGNVVLRYEQSGGRAFEQFRAGSGDRLGDEIRHPTTHPFPGALETEIRIAQSEAPSVVALFYRGSSIDDARSVYQTLSGYLRALWVNAPLQERYVRGANLPPALILRISPTARVELSLFRTRNGERYYVELTLSRLNWQ